MIAGRLLLWLTLLLPPAGEGGREMHDVHLTYARMVVEGATATCRIRLFKDDLALALGRHHRRPKLELAASAETDSLFEAYFNERFVLEQAGRRLRGTIVASGEEKEMWWYTVRFDAGGPVHDLALRNAVLFELFDDQRNIMKLMHVPSGKQFSFYFVPGDAKAQRIAF